MAKKFLSGLKKGALHKELGVKSGTKIPASKLTIKSNDNPLEKKRKQFALNAKNWNKGKSNGYDMSKAEKKLGVVH